MVNPHSPLQSLSSSICSTKRFKKASRRIRKQGKDGLKLLEVVTAILSGTLKPRHKDHALRGRHRGKRECHIEPDWLLVYKVEDDVLILLDTGSHAEIFGM